MRESSFPDRIYKWFTPTSDALFLKRWMGLSLLLHLIAAIFSIGYQAADEHFQILEFLSYKLGDVPVSDLSVEFGERMRPWMQVGIYWILVQCCQLIGLASPHAWAMMIRVFTGLLGWMSLVGLIRCGKDWFPTQRAYRTLIVTSALLWYLPILHVRPSSEGLGGTAFVLGLSVLWRAHVRSKGDPAARKPLATQSWWIAGLLFGVSFEARFQMALMISGALAWILFLSHNKPQTRFLQIGKVVAGILLVVGLGRIVDYWGYGEWSFSPWNYFQYNLVRGEVSRYGQSPWWDIYRMSSTESWPIIGLLVSLAFTFAWMRHPLHILTWSQLPFTIVHFLIAHKEYRFFFPLGSAGPAALVLAFWPTFLPGKLKWPTTRFFKELARAAALLILLLNFSGLITLCLVPVSRLIQFQQAVYQKVIPGQPFYLYTMEGDPFTILGTPTYFYRPKELRVISLLEPGLELPEGKGPAWLYHSGFDLPEETQKYLIGCKLVFRTLPEDLVLLKPLGWLDRIHVSSLYRCEIPGRIQK